jgi:hypothetical protein
MYSLHMCVTLGLPAVLTGHIVPALMIASLIGIRPLSKVGCKVIFNNEKGKVVFNRNG